MSLKRGFYGFATLSLSCFGVFALAIERVFSVAVLYLARPFTIGPRFATAGGPDLGRHDYAAPPFHSLRHEAGTSRRAADRHI